MNLNIYKIINLLQKKIRDKIPSEINYGLKAFIKSQEEMGYLENSNIPNR